MAKDITLYSPDGSTVYYPKTVSELVYNNDNGKTLKEEINSINGTINGILWEGAAKNGDVIFTSDVVNEGDVIYIKLDKTYSAGGIKILDKEGNSLGDGLAFTNITELNYTIPSNFGSAKMIWGANWDNLYIENKTNITNSISDINNEIDTIEGDINTLKEGNVKLNYIDIKQNKNLIETVYSGKYVPTSTKVGNKLVLYSNSECEVSRAIVEGGKKYVISYTNTQPHAAQCEVFTDENDIVLYYSSNENIFTAPEGSKYFYITSNWKGNKYIDFQIEEGDTPTKYIEPKKQIDIDSLDYRVKETIEFVNTELNNIPKPYVDETNLFDKDSMLYYGYISSHNSINNKIKIDVNTQGNYEHAKVPVTPNTTYTLSFTGTHAAKYFVYTDENLILVSDLLGDFKNGFTFTTPENCYYVCFTTGFKTYLSNIQLELGDTVTEYTEYNKTYFNYDVLPPDIKNNSGSIDNSRHITVANSDKIGFFSNSFLNGYCMHGKHPITNLSMFSDYIHYNHGISGIDVLETIKRINDNKTWLGVIPVQNWGLTYAVAAMRTNDGGMNAKDRETHYYNNKLLCKTFENMGAVPILSTEHTADRLDYSLKRLSDEEGYLFCNWGGEAKNLYNTQYKPFWFQGHPATRTHFMWFYGLKKYLDTLPQPKQVLKLFRVRNFIDTTDLNNLMYESNLDRAERYSEINLGCSELSEATEKYFDRLDGTEKSHINIYDEYQKIQSKTAVNFGNYALLEVITPYDRNNLKKVSVKLTSTGINKVYCRKLNNLDNPIPDSYVLAFTVTSGIDKFKVGNKFNITGGTLMDTSLIGEYTVTAIFGNTVVTDVVVTSQTTSGTDKPTCNISGVTIEGSSKSPNGEYWNRIYKPVGEWKEVTITDGEIVLDNFIKDITVFDKISLLFVGTSITISDIDVTVSGDKEKERKCKELTLNKKGTSVIDNTKFDTDWQGSTLTTYVPVSSASGTESLPVGITTVKEMVAGDKISQNINTNLTYADNLQIIVTARYFPEYIDSDSKWENSAIVRDSYDFAKLAVYINDDKVAVIPVGLWWGNFVIDVPYMSGNKLQIECLDKSVQLAKVECNIV